MLSSIKAAECDIQYGHLFISLHKLKINHSSYSMIRCLDLLTWCYTNYTWRTTELIFGWTHTYFIVNFQIKNTYLYPTHINKNWSKSGHYWVKFLGCIAELLHADVTRRLETLKVHAPIRLNFDQILKNVYFMNIHSFA